jgi:hypothetical protein
MKIIKSSDLLISENKAGNRKFWRLHILQDDTAYDEGRRVARVDFYTQSEWYQLTKTGRETKKQQSEPYFAAPTNVGRANERNSEEQAFFEFDAIIKKQLDAGFYREGEKVDSWPMPMLAHKFKDHMNKVEWPSYIQPKLNGMRMLFNGTDARSRGNKEIIPEVIQHLQFDTGGFILDGELMLPNNVLLQESMAAIKKYRPELSPLLMYHVYDIVDNELPYAMRQQIIVDLMHDAPPNVVMVKTVACTDETEVYNQHTQFVSEGYEGTMIRNPSMAYEIGKRSYSLLKLKDFVDAEYRIFDIIDGGGSDTGLAIFILETDDGNRFNCRPEGTQSNRAELYINRKELVGKFLTVRYQELSRDGIPIFPVGVSIRIGGEF